MTTIVITTIAILIAAAAALAIVFYGGGMYFDGDVGARANSYMNAGANVVAAIDQYRMNERSEPANVAALEAAGYFHAGSSPGTITLTAGSPGKVTIDGVPADVCTRINQNLSRGAMDDQSVHTAAATSVQGCTMSGSTGTYFSLT